MDQLKEKKSSCKKIAVSSPGVEMTFILFYFAIQSVWQQQLSHLHIIWPFLAFIKKKKKKKKINQPIS